MKKFYYEKHISFEHLEQVENSMTIEDVRAFKKLYSKLQADLMARRMYSSSVMMNANFSSNDFKHAFYLGWLAAHCEDLAETPLGKALTEKE